jgi:hypothetical protein
MRFRRTGEEKGKAPDEAHHRAEVGSRGPTGSPARPVLGRVRGRPALRRLRRADPRNSIEPLRSANRTVTCLRSPSRAALEVRIFSARCFGVYASGVPNLAVGAVRCGAAHWPQNLFSRGFAAPQDGAGCGKRCGALPTELRAWGILVLAPGTPHTAPSQRTGPGTVGQVGRG